MNETLNSFITRRFPLKGWPFTIRQLFFSVLFCFSLTQTARLSAMGVFAGEKQLYLSSHTLAPGEPLAIVLESRGGRSLQSASLLSGDGTVLSQAAAFDLDTSLTSVRAVLLSVPNTATTGNAYIRLRMSEAVTGNEIGDTAVFIEARTYIEEIIDLDQTNTAIRTSKPALRVAEADELFSLLNTPPTPLLALEAFIPPVSTQRRTAFYGDRRTYYYSDGSKTTSIHFGIDYGCGSNAPIMAPAAGKVVFAKNRQVSGLTVVLDHGGGVYSLYYHLSSIDAKIDSYVSAGDQLGLSGATGLATGPHLHWEIRVAGEAADPDAFTADDNVLSFLRSLGARSAYPY